MQGAILLRVSGMSELRKIAALFVEADGCYFGQPNVDPWDISRDARSYAGPHPVVAHPPCKRWGRYWSGGPSANVRRNLGDDMGCFATALWAVRTFGGVLEHPEASKAWEYFGLKTPRKSGGWVAADAHRGMTCCVEQGHYGHAARKATWLYSVGVCTTFHAPIWGASSGKQRLDAGFHSKAERAASTPEKRLTKRLTEAERMGTPVLFRDRLVAMARDSQL